MESSVYFYEKQRFNQWWLWLILFAPQAVMVGIFVVQYQTSHVFPKEALYGYLPLLVISVVMLGFTKLETKITEDGIYVRFFPFHFRYHFFAWNAISRKYVREYKPLAEYGGWGIRGVGKNMAFNVKGNMGLQLELQDGKRKLIGTQQAEELESVLKRFA